MNSNKNYLRNSKDFREVNIQPKQCSIKTELVPNGALVTPPGTPPILGITLGLLELSRFGGGGISAPLNKEWFTSTIQVRRNLSSSEYRLVCKQYSGSEGS